MSQNLLSTRRKENRSLLSTREQHITCPTQSSIRANQFERPAQYGTRARYFQPNRERRLVKCVCPQSTEAGWPVMACRSTLRRSKRALARLSARSCAIIDFDVAAACCCTIDFRQASKTLKDAPHCLDGSLTLDFKQRRNTEPGTLQSWFMSVLSSKSFMYMSAFISLAFNESPGSNVGVPCTRSFQRDICSGGTVLLFIDKPVMLAASSCALMPRLRSAITRRVMNQSLIPASTAANSWRAYSWYFSAMLEGSPSHPLE